MPVPRQVLKDTHTPEQTAGVVWLPVCLIKREPSSSGGALSDQLLHLPCRVSTPLPLAVVAFSSLHLGVVVSPLHSRR